MNFLQEDYKRIKGSYEEQLGSTLDQNDDIIFIDCIIKHYQSSPSLFQDQEQHSHSQVSMQMYKECSSRLLKLFDLVDIFTSVNQAIINNNASYRQELREVKQKRKEGRVGKEEYEQQLQKINMKYFMYKQFKVTDFFIRMNETLSEIKTLLKQIRVEPVRGPPFNSQQQQQNQSNQKQENQQDQSEKQNEQQQYFNLWSYYNGLSEFERIEYDSIIKINPQNNKPIFPAQRTMPRILNEDMIKFIELKNAMEKYMDYCTQAVKPVKLWFCCFCRGRRSSYRRTSCFCCFRRVFGSTTQLGLILQKTFEGHGIQIPVDQNKSNNKNSKKIYLDCMFFTATCEPLDDGEHYEYRRLPTFIFCNPNAMYYQHMVNHPHAFYLRFFLNKNMNVCVWNYRGYGLSESGGGGGANPYNLRSDAEAVLRYLREELKLTGKVGVYGRSLGGIPTTHLADKVDMIFADRTFANFSVLAQRKFHSKISKYLFKVSTLNWESSNMLNFIDKGADKCYKVVLTEKNDEIVEVHSSLMVGIAKEIHRRSLQNNKNLAQLFSFLSKNNKKTSHRKQLLSQKTSNNNIKKYLESIRFITNLEHDFYTVIDYQSQKEHLQTDENELNSSGFFFCCAGSKISSKAHHPITKVQPDLERGNSILGGMSDSSQVMIRFKNNQQSHLYKESINRIRKALNIQTLNKFREVSIFYIDIWKSLYQICNQMYDLEGAQLTFFDVININKQIQIKELKNFLILMKVYGSCPELKQKQVAPNIFSHRISREISLVYILILFYNFFLQSQVNQLCQILQQNQTTLENLKSIYPFFQDQINLILTHYEILTEFFISTLEFLKAPPQFYNTQQQIQQNLQQNNLQEDSSLSSNQQDLSHKSQQYSNKIFQKNNNLNQQQNHNLDENYLSPNYIGHTIPLKCGHIGQPSNEEAYMMQKHLRAAGFLDNPNVNNNNNNSRSPRNDQQQQSHDIKQMIQAKIDLIKQNAQQQQVSPQKPLFINQPIVQLPFIKNQMVLPKVKVKHIKSLTNSLILQENEKLIQIQVSSIQQHLSSQRNLHNDLTQDIK